MEFKVGDRVLIKETSAYYGKSVSNPADIEGVIRVVDFPSGYPYTVDWDNKYWNQYPEGHLRLAHYNPWADSKIVFRFV